MKNKVLRVLTTILGIIAILCIAFMTMIAAALSGDGSFYTPFAIVLGVALILWLLLWAFSEFYAITTNTENPNVEKFIDWILSPQGQALVEKTGYVPIK